jgi:hypothetical protein
MHSVRSRVVNVILKWGFVLCFLTSGQLLAQSTPTWTRAVSFGGTGSDSGTAVKVDAYGNRYVTGGFSSSATFGNRVLNSAGGSDIFLAKFERSGELRWLLQAGGPGDDIGNDIALDLAGNIYVTGSFTDSATFPSVHGPAKTVTGVGQTIFLAKYQPSGTLVWVQTGTTQEIGEPNEGYGVAVEPVTGTVFVTGLSQAPATFSSSDGTEHTVPGPFTWHMFLVKYDSDGNFQWGQSNEASPNTVPYKVAVDEDNNAYVTGWLEGSTIFHSNDGHDITVTGLSQPIQSFPDFPDDAFIVKYDAEGNVKWVNLIGGYKGIGTDIGVSHDGQISATGFIGNLGGGTPSQVETIATSQPGGPSINLGGGQLTNPYNKDAFVATYDSAGVLLNARRIGGVQDDGGSGIAYDRKGNLYVAGTFQGTINVEGHTLTGEKPFNLFVLKFRERSREEQRKPSAAAGELAWAKKADGPGQEGLVGNAGMGVTPRGTVLVTGVYRDVAVFDDITLHSAGEEDIFLSQLNRHDNHDNDGGNDNDNDDCDGPGCVTQGTGAATVNFGSGFTASGLQLNGHAKLVGTRLLLTDTTSTKQVASAFWTTPVNVQSFTNAFSFQLTNPAADGFTFTIQNAGITAIGSPGGGLGYGSIAPTTAAITKSVAVKFDLFDNSGEGINSTGLYTNGVAPTVPATTLGGGVNLHSGDVFLVQMNYDGATLAVTITDATTPAHTFTTSFPIDIPATVGGNTAFVGFTAGTGGQTATQEILNWTYNVTSGFSLTLMPSTRIDAQQALTSYRAIVTPTNGFNGTVALSLSGVPAGITAFFSDTSTVTGSGFAVVAIDRIPATFPPGFYTFTVTGVSGSISHSATAALAIAQDTGGKISLGSGFSAAGLQLNGHAKLNETRLQLTDTSSINQAASAFWEHSNECAELQHYIHLPTDQSERGRLYVHDSKWRRNCTRFARSRLGLRKVFDTDGVHSHQLGDQVRSFQ